MKTVLFVRHAKSSWEDADLGDRYRTLLPIGIQRSRRIGEYLSSKGVKTDLIFSSPAVRAYETAKIIAAEIAYPIENIIIQPQIYEASESEIWDLVYALDDTITTVMIVGHNPVTTRLVNALLESPIDYMPTSGTAAFRFETEHWVEINSARHRTEFIVHPKIINS